MRLVYYFTFVFFALGCILLNAYSLALRIFRRRPGNQTRLRKAAAWLLRLFITVTNRLGVMTCRFEGMEYLPKQQAIIIANHTGLLDAPLLLSQYPHCTIIYKGSLSRNPLFREMLDGMGFIPNQPAHSMINQALDHLAAGDSLLIFPEGTRGTPGQPVKIHPGFINLARRAHVPICPVVIKNPTNLLGKSRSLLSMPPYFPQPVHFQIHPTTTFAVSPSTRRSLSRDIEDWYNRQLNPN